MPSTTALSGYYFHNAGPLTTTFTAPESCVTAAGYTAFAQTEVGGHFPYYRLHCGDLKFGDCFPDGPEIDNATWSLTQKPEPTYQYFLYHSPGIDCPSGWTTAATALRDSDGNLSTSGDIFSPAVVGTVTAQPEVLPEEQIFIQALEEGEEAALCCPSGFTAGGGGAQCYSSLPKSQVRPASVCQIGVDGVRLVPDTFTYGEHTVTGKAISDVKPTRSFTTKYEKWDREKSVQRQHGFAPMTYVPIVTLVQKEKTSSATPVPTNDVVGSENNSEGAKSDDDKDKDDDNEDGASLNWTTEGLMAAVWGVAAVAGAALLA